MLLPNRQPDTRGKARRPSRATKPALENLEDRKLLYATLGGSWAYGSRITYSFVPDGTSIGGTASNLFAKLNASYTTATWQAAFQKAAAIWSSYANINLAQVSDDGSPFGTSGNQQGDSRFGDIRIAMIPQSGGVLAFATLPAPFNGGTNAGDIVFNSNMSWKVNADYDIQTVALHEMGHALGLDHASLATGVMYSAYNGIKQTLTTDDQSGIQAVYGAYPADKIDDGSFATAVNLTSLIDKSLQVSLGGQSLAGATDSDYFKVTVPTGTTSKMTVTMQSTALSSVAPRLTVYNSAQTTLGQTSLANVYGGTATYTVSNVVAGQTYYIRATAASSLGAYGAYGIQVNFSSASQSSIAPPTTTVLAQTDATTESLSESNFAWELATKIADGLDNYFTDVTAADVYSFLQWFQIGTWGAYATELTVADLSSGQRVDRLDVNTDTLPDHAPGLARAASVAPATRGLEIAGVVPPRADGVAHDGVMDQWDRAAMPMTWLELLRARRGHRGRPAPVTQPIDPVNVVG